MNSQLHQLISERKPRKERLKSRSAMFRKNVHLRAGSRCEICKYSVPDILEAHHIVPIAKGGETDITNMILLCPNCHALTHLCARVLADFDESCLMYGLAESGIPDEQAKALALVGTERAIVTFAGEIKPRADQTFIDPQSPHAQAMQSFQNAMDALLPNSKIVGEETTNDNSISGEPESRGLA